MQITFGNYEISLYIPTENDCIVLCENIQDELRIALKIFSRVVNVFYLNKEETYDFFSKL